MLENQFITYEYPVKNEAYMAQSSAKAGESTFTVGFEEKGSLLEKDEKLYM